MTRASRSRIERRAARNLPVDDSNIEPRFTKFIEPAWAAATAAGKLKFGTLEEYRRAENATEHRLSDVTDGTYSLRSTAPLVRLEGNVGGVTMTGITMVSGSSGANILKSDMDAYAFCATRGDYSRARHRKILAKNPSLTDYVVFDTRLFSQAATMLQADMQPHDPQGGLVGRIRYADTKDDVDTTGEIHGRSDAEMFEKAVFVKPRAFEHEHELRFVILFIEEHGNNPIFVSSRKASIAAAFLRAVVKKGRHIL